MFFRFAHLTREMATSFFEKRGIEVPESIVLFKDEKHYLASQVIFGILKIFWALFVWVWSLSFYPFALTV